MPKIYDNIENDLLKALKITLDVSFRSDFCVGYFNLRGWKYVASHIDRYEGEEEKCCRLLLGMQKPGIEMIREAFSKSESGLIDNREVNAIRKRLAQEFKEQLTIGIPTDEDETGLRKLSEQIRENKLIVRLFLCHPLHAKLYLLFRQDEISPIVGYLGSSNLTLAGLSKQGELNVDVLEQDAARKLSKWFDERWKNRWCIDISNELADIIDASWASDSPVPPFHIYLKMAYHLSREARAGLSEFTLPKIFEKELLDFQQKAVLIAAHHLNKRDGVIIGDVVGLGKTITAAALAKIFEDDFFLETLILCPKNLTEMWEDYVHKYRLRAKVLSQTMVQKQLPKLRRYRLIVIDESHNLRNREGKRYKAIEEYIKLNDAKVILLSATPYNKDYRDLSNQLRLFISEDKDIGISPERYIAEVGGKMQFMAKLKKQVPLRSLLAFEKSDFADDWRELMRLYLVRRTRSFIKTNYARTDPDRKRKFLTFSDGSRSYFSERTPRKVEYSFDPDDVNDQYARLYSPEVVDTINGLNLPRYGLGNYLDEKSAVKAIKSEEKIKSNLSRAGKRLMGFARTNLFKRLESSGYSFLLSLSRHILRNFTFIHAIENRLDLPIGAQEADILDEFLEDEDADHTGDPEEKISLISEEHYLNQAEKVYHLLKKGYKNRFNWIRSELFVRGLKSSLLSDSISLLEILRLGKDWNPDDDRQVNALYELCAKKHGKEKILIFTQFADTAYYLEDQFKKRRLEQAACVTGRNEHPTGFAHRFSPVSNERTIPPEQEIRVLITTDVLSEGQNLQDAHIIVNYDLPWAIIRLIQRAGRVDRIGQRAEEILCYSFLPEEGIERIINLRSRLKIRIRENAEVVGSDETFFDGDPVNIHDLYNEKSSILDEDEDGEVDLASYAFEIWKKATDADPKLKKIIPDLPNVTYSTKENTEGKEKEGVIVYTKTADDNDILAYVDTKGQMITQSQLTILKVARCSADTAPLHKLEHHHKLVEKGMEYISDIESDIGGQLGRKSSVRYRVYTRLNQYYQENKETLFVNEGLKRAVEEIHRFPLKEFARETMGRQLKAGISDIALAELVVSLREEDKLCIVSEDERVYREPYIICSLGLKS